MLFDLQEMRAYLCEAVNFIAGRLKENLERQRPLASQANPVTYPRQAGNLSLILIVHLLLYLQSCRNTVLISVFGQDRFLYAIAW